MINFLSIEEKALCDTILEIEYGEIVDVEIRESPRVIEQNVRGAYEKLIKIIRNGNQHIENIKVHQGKPVQVTVTGTKRNLKFKMKIMLDK